MDVDYFVGKRYNSIPIKHFDITILRNKPSVQGNGISVAVMAPSGSGKSWVVRAILEEIKDYPCGIIISEMEHADVEPFYGKFCPDTYIYDKFSIDIISKVLERQEQICYLAQEQKEKGIDIDTRFFLVMDDCYSEANIWTHNSAMRKLLFEGRHLNITFILTMQYPLGITPDLRANFTYVFILAEDKVTNLKKIREHYAGMFPSYDAFVQVFSQLVKDHGCMVIKNRGVVGSLLNKIFYYKAPDLTNVHFTIGCKQYIKFHDVNYRDKNKRKNIINVNELFANAKKSKEQITVNIKKH